MTPMTPPPGEVFADYLNVSMPADHAESALADVRCMAASAGLSQVGDHLYRSVDDGTLKLGKRGRVAIVSCSGAMLALFRGLELLPDLLGAVAQVPHAVSLLHATVDVEEDAPPVIARLVEKGRAGHVKFTRKAVPPSQVKRWIGDDAEGRETGTVYFGKRGSADVWGKVYDKRQERIDRGFADPGPLTRYEMAFHAGVGCTLRDVMAPAGVFWHHASPALLRRPPDAPEWHPHAVGYQLRPARDLPPMARAMRLLQDSMDVRRLVELAHEAGPEGPRMLLALLRERLAAPTGPLTAKAVSIQ